MEWAKVLTFSSLYQWLSDELDENIFTLVALWVPSVQTSPSPWSESCLTMTLSRLIRSVPCCCRLNRGSFFRALEIRRVRKKIWKTSIKSHNHALLFFKAWQQNKQTLCLGWCKVVQQDGGEWSLKQREDGPVSGHGEQKGKGSRWDRDLTIWYIQIRGAFLRQVSPTKSQSHSGPSLDYHLPNTDKTHDSFGNYQSAAGGSCGCQCRWV